MNRISKSAIGFVSLAGVAIVAYAVDRSSHVFEFPDNGGKFTYTVSKNWLKCYGTTQVLNSQKTVTYDDSFMLKNGDVTVWIAPYMTERRMMHDGTMWQDDRFVSDLKKLQELTNYREMVKLLCSKIPDPIATRMVRTLGRWVGISRKEATP